jgi:hypothetical protein
LERLTKDSGFGGRRLSPIYDKDVVWPNDAVCYPLSNATEPSLSRAAIQPYALAVSKQVARANWACARRLSFEGLTMGVPTDIEARQDRFAEPPVGPSANVAGRWNARPEFEWN